MSKRIVKSIIALFFVAVGLSAAQLICSGSFIASFGEKAQKWLPICIFCVLGAGFGVFGYVIAPRLVKAYHFVTGSIMRRFTDMPLSVIFVGVIGLILGLLVAFLLSTFLLNIEPHFIGIILAVSAYLIFGTLGCRGSGSEKRADARLRLRKFSTPRQSLTEDFLTSIKPA